MQDDTLSAEFYELMQEVMESNMTAYDNHAFLGQERIYSMNYWRYDELLKRYNKAEHHRSL